MSIKVIGLGMGRTGTSSLKVALEKLGYGPCYHMEDLINNPADVRYWKEIDRKGETDWQSLFGAYQSAVDFPTIGYYKDILRVYPAAKVILTERDEKSWYESASKTILNVEPGIMNKIKMSLLLPFSSRLQKLMQVFKLSRKFWETHIGKNFRDKEKAISFYRKWNQQIKEEIPADNLLVFKVAHGWEPLCKFLGTSIPDEPFPTSNSRNEFRAKNKKLI